MAYSATRLTPYAVLSALEEDLRALVLLHLTSEASCRDPLGEELRSRAMDRLVRDGAIFDNDPELEQLAFYLDFGTSTNC